MRIIHALTTHISPMNITLTSEFERRIAEKVDTGLYSSASEVIRDGLRMLFERDALREQQLAVLKREVAAGFQQLENGQISPDSVTAIFDKDR